MCEILVHIVDKTNPDKTIDSNSPKLGDVIDIREDGAIWGGKELSGDLRVIIVTQSTVDDLKQLLAPAQDDNHDTLLFRAYSLDLNNLIAEDFDAWLNDFSGRFYTVNHKTDLSKYIIKKEIPAAPTPEPEAEATPVPDTSPAS
jgi:hypothetical protein